MLLNNRQFIVKERAGILKLTDVYDIFDPQTQVQIGIAREEPPVWAKYLRLLVKKYVLPTTIHVYEKEEMPALFSLRKKPSFLRTTVLLIDPLGRTLGLFRSKFLSLGGGFFVMDSQGNQFAEVKGDWKGWNFRFLGQGGRELGVVTKKWAGLGKELFTTADNYVIALNETIVKDANQAVLLLAAGLAIDVVFNER
jgi:uncharacterized protein YxjI